MRFKNIAFAAAVLLIAVTALSGCKGQGESGGNSSAFFKGRKRCFFLRIPKRAGGNQQRAAGDFKNRR